MHFDFGYNNLVSIQEELVYANYGLYEDLRYLQDELKINLTGRLLLVRYGVVYRGDKVLNAQRFNAGGVILYRCLRLNG